MQEKDFDKIEMMNNVCINVFAYENKLVFPMYVSNVHNSHYVYIKYFDTFMFHKTKNKNKKCFCRSCLQCFISENILTKHREDCLNINDKQSVRLRNGIIKFENCFKQLPIPFKIYADFE